MFHTFCSSYLITGLIPFAKVEGNPHTVRGNSKFPYFQVLVNSHVVLKI